MSNKEVLSKMEYNKVDAIETEHIVIAYVLP